MVAHAETLSQQGLAEFGDFLFVEVERDERAIPLQQILKADDFTLDVESTGFDHVQGFVQDHFLSLPQAFARDRRVQAHLHLASGHIHVAGAVLIEAREDGVGGRRRGQFLDFGAQRFDLRFGFLQSRDELFVLFVGLVELVTGLVQPTDFFFHRLNLDAKLFDLPILFVVTMNHVWVSLGQPLRNVLNGISEGP